MIRFLYQNLLNWKHSSKRKPLIIRGARQVGKTWLVKEFGKKEYAQIHVINFEKDAAACSLFQYNLSPRKLLQQLGLYLDRTIDIYSDLLFFDEVQECPRAITSLKYYAEELPELSVCCAGSHLGMSLSSSSFPVGKIDELTLHPMSFGEFLLSFDEKLYSLLIDEQPPLAMVFHERLWEALKLYYFVGGMPEVVQVFVETKDKNHEYFTLVRDIQRQLINGYQADFAKHAGKVNAVHINRVFENIPEQITKVVDDSVNRYRFKEVIPGYSKFSQLEGPIDWLTQAGLCIPVYIVESPAIPLRSRRKRNVFKLFLHDIGLLGCMADIPHQSILLQDYGTYKGYLAENYVARELTSAGVTELYSWRGRTSEIEYLLQIENNVIPVEVKSGSRINTAKSLAAYREKFKPAAEVIISANPEKQVGNRKYLPLYRAGSLPETL